MRILMLIPEVFYSARGTPLSAYHRIRDLIDRGHEVEVLTYKLGDAPPDPKLVVHRAFGPHFASSLKQGPSRLKIWFDLLFLISLVYRLTRSRYDLLYAHEEGGFLGALVAPLFRVPLVYDMHSSLPLQIRDWGFSRLEAVVSLFRWVERFTLKRTCAAVAISPGVRDAALEAWPEATVVMILNRFAAEKNASPEEGRRLRSEIGLEPAHKLVLYTGSFVPLQALDLLVEAIPRVVARAPEARFVLVGGRPHEIEELDRLAARVGASEYLSLIPHRPPAEMPIFTAACDVLVSPRVKGINPPGKLFSYLSSGRPLVATDRPIHNQLVDASCAILTTPDASGIADGILIALTDVERVRCITQAARELVDTRYGPERREAAYDELFRLVESTVRRS